MTRSHRLAFILAISVAVGACAGGHQDIPIDGAQDGGGIENECSVASIEALLLKRRNWEGHGTDIRLASDGDYVVTAHYLGTSKQVRSGKAPPIQVQGLIDALNAASFCDLPNEYQEPAVIDSSWWGYELTLVTDRDSWSVRFFSEDETVPEPLFRVIQVFSEITR